MTEVNLQSIEALAAQIIRKREQQIAAAHAEADRALGALKIVAEMLNTEVKVTDVLKVSETANFALLSPTENKSTKKIYPTATWVAQIVNELNGSIISQPVVFERLLATHPEIRERDPSNVRSQVAMILKRMEVKGDLIISREPYGSHPTEYRKRTVPKQVPVTVQPPKDDQDWE